MQTNSDHSDAEGLDTTQTGLNPPRIIDTRYGKITMHPHYDLPAGSFVTLTFEYTVGEVELKPGSTIRLGTPCTGWSEPLIARSRYWYRWQPAAFDRINTEVHLSTNSNAEVDVQIEERMLRYTPAGGAWRWWIVVEIRKESLSPGDRLNIVYGSTKWGEDGAQVQKFPESGAHFIALLDPTGSGDYVEIPSSPFEFDVIANNLAQFLVTAPSLVEAGKSYPLKLALTDLFWSPVSTNLDTKADIIGAQFPNQAKITTNNSAHVEIPEIEFQSGITHIRVRDRSNGLEGISNPVMSRHQPVKEQIYWGDLHTQTQYHGPGGWSVGTPNELYRYAREITHLDFVAITDDVAPLSPGWKEIQQAAIDHYDPGKFVTFKGFELCSKRYGHRNTIYADAEIEDNYDPEIFNGTIENFWDYFLPKNVIQIPHHTFVWTNWNKHHPELEPLVELYSTWGRSEKHGNEPWQHSEVPGGGVQGGLGRGYRLGIIGSTDTHTGMPGRSVKMGERFHNMQREKGGIAAVYASELTREGIFTALRNRRTYATTGVRIILDFSINGSPMGSEITWDGSNPNLQIFASGTDRIRQIEIVRNNVDVQSIDADDYEVNIKFEDNQLTQDLLITDFKNKSIAFYYVRIIQIDGEMAWSSPIWLSLSD